MTPLHARDVVLVENLGGGHSATRQLRAYAAMAREGLRVLDRVPVREVERIRDWVQRPAADRPLVVVAGGDGTIGTVVNDVVNNDAILGFFRSAPRITVPVPSRSPCQSRKRFTS